MGPRGMVRPAAGGRNESPWEGAEGMHKAYAGGPRPWPPPRSHWSPQAQSLHRPPSQDPRAQAVTAGLLSATEHQRSSPRGPASGRRGAGGVVARSWGMLRSRPGLLGSVFPPTSLGPRSISSPRPRPSHGWFLARSALGRREDPWRVWASASDGAGASGSSQASQRSRSTPSPLETQRATTGLLHPRFPNSPSPQEP